MLKALDLFENMIAEGAKSTVLEIKWFGVKAMFKKVKGYQLSSELVICWDVLTEAMERTKKMHKSEKHKDVARCYKMFAFLYCKFNLEEEAQNALNKAKSIYHELYGENSL